MTDDTVDMLVSGVPTGTMTVTEVTGLINLFNAQLLAMENRLVAKMDVNSGLAADRWTKHDAEFERNRNLIVARFEKVEASILKVETVLESHLDREHDNDVAAEARVKPIKMSVSWMWAQRKDILLFIIFLLATAAAAGEWFGRLIGPHAP